MTGPRSAGAAAAIALHALALGLLLGYAPARDALLEAAPLMVELIAPQGAETPRTEPPRPETPPRAPRPQPPAQPAPAAAAPAESPPVEAPATTILQAALPAPAPAAAQAVAAARLEPVTPPVYDADYLSNPAPAYPRLARRMGEQGRVLLHVLVSAAGIAEEVQVRTSSGHARLDEAAREAVRAWKFAPARRGDRPIAAWVLIPISFRLEG